MNEFEIDLQGFATNSETNSETETTGTIDLTLEIINSSKNAVKLPRLAIVENIYYYSQGIVLATNYGNYNYNDRLDVHLIDNYHQLVQLVDKLTSKKARKHIRDINYNDVQDIAGMVLKHITNNTQWIRQTCVNKSGTVIEYAYPTLNSLQRVVAFELIRFVSYSRRMQDRLIPLVSTKNGIEIDYMDANSDMIDVLDKVELDNILMDAPRPLANCLYGLLIGDLTISNKTRYNTIDHIILNTELFDFEFLTNEISQYIDKRVNMKFVSKDKKQKLNELKLSIN